MQVEQSATRQQRATRLLDAAKRAVEIAIEDSEAEALHFLGATLLAGSQSQGQT